MAEQFVTVAELRAQMATVLGRLGENSGPVYVTQRGQARAVLLPVAKYQELLEELEYLDDSVESLLGKERQEAGETTRPIQDLIAELEAAQSRRPKKNSPVRKRAQVPR